MISCKDLGKAIPYRVCDLADNSGWASVGMDHDTAEFTIDSILSWWKHMGCKSYSQADELLIMADAGGGGQRPPPEFGGAGEVPVGFLPIIVLSSSP
jgi:hypothetical protein